MQAVCVAAAQCCFSNHSLLPVAFVDNCCKLLRAPIIIFFQAQPEFMMAKRGEWPMGCEIARRRFLLTSATGAATVSQPQCRDAPRWAGLEFKRKRNSYKKITSGLEHNAVCAKGLDSSLMSVLSEKVERAMKANTHQSPMLPLPSHCDPEVCSDLLPWRHSLLCPDCLCDYKVLYFLQLLSMSGM